MEAAAIRSLIGYGTNLTRFGMVFHIQTEDSGPHYAHIDTHLFSGDGQVIHSLRIDYSHHLGVGNLNDKVVKAMKVQHRKMCRMFESGELDDRIRTLLDVPEAIPPGPDTRRLSRPAAACLPRSRHPSSVRRARRPSTVPASSVTPEMECQTDEPAQASVRVPRAPRVPEFGPAQLRLEEEPGLEEDLPDAHRADTLTHQEGPFTEGTRAEAPGQSDGHRLATPGSSTGSRRRVHDWDAAVNAARAQKRRFGR